MKPARNDPCPCGSGKKFKKCHLGMSMANFQPPGNRTWESDADDRAELPIAGQLGITSLCHYQDFNLKSRDDHAERLKDILQNHRIWCSNPANFNDPWDCKPYFDPELLDDPQAQAEVAETLISTRKGGTELNHVDEKLRKDPQFLKAAIQQFSRMFSEFVGTRWGVYCLSPDPCLNLMWSHYARDHRGICLEFAVQRTKFYLTGKVQYLKKYPQLMFHDQDSRSIMLVVKSDDWEYEQEFRLICPRFTDVRASPLIMDGNYLPIGPTDLKSIILGCQIDDEATATIETLVMTHAPHVRVRRAKRAPNRYRLVIDD